MDEAQSYQAWIGRTELVHDDLCAGQAAAAAATLDATTLVVADGAALPLLWHWFYFLPRAPQASLGPDGHPQRGGFMPPISYPRRMFAGARLRLHQPLRLGLPAEREGRISDVTVKHGRSGALAFVTVDYRYHQAGQLCLEETQDIVYREPGQPVAAPTPVELPDVPPGAWSQRFHADSRLLFRFSALTFNAHRIHYDRPYAMSEEGYPGLVVHGPLTAILLLELLRQHSPRPVVGFQFRGLAPLFDLAPFRLVGQLNGDEVELEVQGPDGRPTMRASAELGT